MEEQVEETTESTVDEDIGLYFKRFSKEKQDQIRALVNYATLMGLDGKDLVSIGGKLDRIKEKQAIMNNRAIVEGMSINPIGKDSDCCYRWSYKGADGTLYWFTNAGWYDVTIKNTRTGKRHDAVITDHYNVGRWLFKGNRQHLPNVMLNVHYGNIILP